ncbi:MAG TPA: putative CRISPR-associated protein, partial [Thermoguttaceae bacterium]|nr:putative CRISPR-associated protein [Thermoguttaceae bacterium]
MGRKILCTTGTSIAGGGKSFQEADQKEEYRSHIRQRMEDLRPKRSSPEEFFRKLSAETHSLAKLKVSESDEVVLLHSETLDGQLCAEAVKEVLENELGLHPHLVKIEGLQVNDGKRFRQVGIQKLFEVLTEETKGWLENPEQKAILNATGGFKSVVPYVTLFGLLHRL